MTRRHNPFAPARLLGRFAVSVAVLAACGSTRGEADAGGAADSLVVERSPCFGACPTYRVRLAASGDVRYEPRQPGRGPAVDTTPVAARVDPGTLGALLAAADSAGVFALPANVRDAPALCAAFRTDAPTVTITRFSADGVQRVIDQHGCVADEGEAARRLARLRAWEERVDSLVGARRWARG